MVTRQQAIDYIRFGQQGNYVTNDENGRTITLAVDYVDTLPDCYIEQGDVCVGKMDFNSAVEFLFEEVTA